MAFENITRCPACGAEGGKLAWLSTNPGAVLYDGDKKHECPKPIAVELKELL